MSSDNPDHGLEDVDPDAEAPLIEGDAEEAAADAAQLETHAASLKAARRRRYIRLCVGTFAALAFVGIFVRLSRWKRPFDCESKPPHSMSAHVRQHKVWSKCARD